MPGMDSRRVPRRPPRALRLRVSLLGLAVANRRHVAASGLRWGRHSGVFFAAGRVFQQRLVEVIHGALRVAEVVGGDGEQVAAELEFQDGAGGGEVGAGLGEVAFGFHLAVAGTGVGGLQGREFRQQFGASLLTCLETPTADENDTAEWALASAAVTELLVD